MDDLTPIRDVADRLGLPLSTLHYWERRGLLTPHRRSGRRYFDSEQVYRVALIKRWRETGRMSIEEIGTLLSREGSAADWQRTVHARIAELQDRIAELDAARAYLGGLLSCTHGHDLERCPDFRATVPLGDARRPSGTTTSRRRTGRASAASDAASAEASGTSKSASTAGRCEAYAATSPAISRSPTGR
ncbi:MerR family transcriptional regulator [Streptomyces flavofungini]|uniref:helix-turn-helix domain-containing protein n=1 Tax=Streptomyces flavofungini TaxID=68200 RepID=UPI0025AF9528|nr:MerR family transcriptional regulator [Streptomyces flavofungini]WJV44931.1 MerR family transcriptional regulator [Streptomyces flavofungini]